MISRSEYSRNSKRRYNPGFTLVELLVVVAILGLSMAMVGGLSVDAISKYRAKSNEMYLLAIFSDAKKRAFVYEQALTVKTHENIISVLDGNGLKIKAYQLSSVTFITQQIVINRFGVASVTTFDYVDDSIPKSLNISSIQ